MAERDFYGLAGHLFTRKSTTGLLGLVLGDAGLGDNNFFQLLGGMRYYIGGKKTLKARHRQDDPTNFLNGITGGAGNAVTGQQSTTPNPPKGGGGGGT